MGGVTLNNRPQCLHTFGNSAANPVVMVAANNANIISGQRVGLFRIILIAAAAGTVTIADSGTNALSQPFVFAINGSLVLDMPDNGDPWWQSTAANPGLQLTNAGTIAVGFDVWWLPQV